MVHKMCINTSPAYLVLHCMAGPVTVAPHIVPNIAINEYTVFYFCMLSVNLCCMPKTVFNTISIFYLLQLDDFLHKMGDTDSWGETDHRH